MANKDGTIDKFLEQESTLKIDKMLRGEDGVLRSLKPKTALFKPGKGIHPKLLNRVSAIKTEIQAIADLQAYGFTFGEMNEYAFGLTKSWIYIQGEGDAEVRTPMAGIIWLRRVEGNDDGLPHHLCAEFDNLSSEEIKVYQKVLENHGYKLPDA